MQQPPALPNDLPPDPTMPILRDKLPFSFWWPLLCGVLAGIGLRLVFMGDGNGAYAAMSASFIYLAPVLVGAVTVYVAEKQKRRSWGYYFVFPCLANILFICGTLLIMVEGLICAILIVPLFSFIGGMSGVIMGAICRLTKWPSHTVYSIAVLPLLLGGLEHKLPLPIKLNTVEHSIYIAAPADKVWQQIMSARDIKPEEVGQAWMYRIGVPLPESGIAKSTPLGIVREIKMGKNIHFRQVMSEWQPNRYAKMHYAFAPDSIPVNALDDHVKIGGHYFDLKTTEYRLEPAGNGTTLTISMEYRVSTQFNWYAAPIAENLIANFEEVILDFYKHRSESAAP